MKAGEVIDAEIGEQDTTKTDDGKDGDLIAAPASDHSRMEQTGIDQPRN